MTIAFTNATNETWKLSTDHAASSYGQPVLIGPDGTAYGKADLVQDSYGDWMSTDQYLYSCLSLADMADQDSELIKRWNRL